MWILEKDGKRGRGYIMLNNKSISLLIPCYNEENGLISIFEKMPDFIDEVIIINNNSDDNTENVAKKYGAYIINLSRKGYGLSYQKGLPCANGDIIVTMDGDSSYPVEKIEDMFNYMDNNHLDFISGCRFPLEEQNAMPFINKIANLTFSWLIRSLFKVNIKDSQSGMWLFRKSILAEIISNNPGMGFSQEIKLNAWLNKNLKCAEVHIPYRSRIGNVKFNKMRDSLKNMRDLTSLFIRLNFAK